jgi:hypothetical protein
LLWHLGLGVSKGTPGRGLYGGELGVQHKDYSTDPISNSLLESMILLGFDKGDKFGSYCDLLRSMESLGPMTQ